MISNFVSTPTVLYKVGSTNLANLRESAFAMSLFAGHTAIMMAVLGSMYFKQSSVIFCSISYG